jgi:hypothetical protein
VRLAALLATLLLAASCHGGSTPGDASGDPLDEALDGEGDWCGTICTGGTTCVDGEVYVLVFAAVPCGAEPWGESDPECSHGTPDLVCDEPSCETADERYAYCIGEGVDWARTLNPPRHLLGLLCPEGRPRMAGDPCAGDGDCRPAAAGRLLCDAVSGACAAAAPVVPPAWFGQHCGLEPADIVECYSETVPGVTCDVCHIRRDEECPAQACTLECEYDEDCPEGYACVCNPFALSERMYCAATTDRLSTQGRASGLPCP